MREVPRAPLPALPGGSAGHREVLPRVRDAGGAHRWSARAPNAHAARTRARPRARWRAPPADGLLLRPRRLDGARGAARSRGLAGRAVDVSDARGRGGRPPRRPRGAVFRRRDTDLLRLAEDLRRHGRAHRAGGARARGGGGDRRADGTVLSVRVGLHTGPVVVRARGHSRRELGKVERGTASLSRRRRRRRCSRTFAVSRRPRCSRLAPTSSGGRRSISWRNRPSPERGTAAGPPGRRPALVRPVVTGALGRLIAQSPTARARQRHGATGVHAAVVGALQLDYAAARLTQRQARDMFATLGGRELSADTLDALIARADGVPLYLEERTKAVAR